MNDLLPHQMPTIGRIVHVVWSTGTGRSLIPGIVTALREKEGTISVTVFPPGLQPIPITYMHHDETATASGTWHWPPR